MKHYELFRTALSFAYDIPGEITEAQMYPSGYVNITVDGEDGKTYNITIRIEDPKEKEKEDVEPF